MFLKLEQSEHQDRNPLFPLRTSIKNQQSKIGNARTHPLPRDGTDFDFRNFQEAFRVRFS
jgi:hypothetical protein